MRRYRIGSAFPAAPPDLPALPYLSLAPHRASRDELSETTIACGDLLTVVGQGK